MIESFFRASPNGEDDDGNMRELRYWISILQLMVKNHLRSVSFRDGASESQFSQVLNNELDQMIKAYQRLREKNIPKFSVIFA